MAATLQGLSGQPVVNTNANSSNNTSTFMAALPYAVSTIALGCIGAVVALVCASTVLKVVGVIAALMGTYAFLATVMCGVLHSGNPAAFKKDIGKYIATGMGSAITSIIEQVARSVLQGIINSFLGKRN